MNTRLWVETNTNQANQPNIDKALKQKSRRLKIRVIRLIRVRKNLKQFVVLNEHESPESTECR